MSEISKLEKEIADKRVELDLLMEQEKGKTRIEAIKELDEFTDDDKINAFDRVYGLAISIVCDVEEKGYMSEDDPHYAYEEVMDLVARDHGKFWKYFNSINKG